MYSKINEVEPPEYHKWQRVRAVSNGKYKDAEIESVTFQRFKEGNKVLYRWEYGVRFTDTGTWVLRQESDISL